MSNYLYLVEEQIVSICEGCAPLSQQTISGLGVVAFVFLCSIAITLIRGQKLLALCLSILLIGSTTATFHYSASSFKQCLSPHLKKDLVRITRVGFPSFQWHLNQRWASIERHNKSLERALFEYASPGHQHVATSWKHQIIDRFLAFSSRISLLAVVESKFPALGPLSTPAQYKKIVKTNLRAEKKPFWDQVSLRIDQQVEAQINHFVQSLWIGCLLLSTLLLLLYRKSASRRTPEHQR